MIIYRSKFLEVNYLELQHLMHFMFTEYASHMDKQGLYHEVLNFTGYRLHKRSRKFLWDLRPVEHLVDETFFEWLFQYIFPKIASFNATAIGFIVNEPARYEKVPRVIRLFGKREIKVMFDDNPETLMKRLKES